MKLQTGDVGTMNKNTQESYLSSLPKLEILIGRYGDKFIFIFSGIFLIWETLGGFNIKLPKFSLYFGVPTSFFIWLFITLLFWKFAYKIFFDIDNNTVTFFMFRKKKPIEFKIEEISKIVFGTYMMFYYNEKKIYYKGYGDLSLIHFLYEKKMPIKITKIGRWLTGLTEEKEKELNRI